MNNSWNKVIYKIGSPIYDKFFNSGIFLNARKQILQSIPFSGEQKILFVGVGTGADLELINYSDLDITAIDYSPDMLGKAKTKFKDSTIKFLEMDAQNMVFEDELFDYVVASLILSVVPDANKCFQEISRVLKHEGKIIIFDKFAPKNKKLSLPKVLLRPIISVLGTDIGRSFEEIIPKNNKSLKVEEDSPVMMNGMYRKIIIAKIH
ncbi:class I SAM-dependent methyltransferase [Paenibacillus macquariensis]|uniref:Methyltransferase domain-containing protein n=1 Tax=Paenibacillus macquariensis TaxID=948756 RepID=A0ABY1KDK1_9BACL|nr:class I SAM-dependent methyltransferase [Paenibacillus macquariensis]OAB27360.1 phosphatidylethanolamine N-methyltransferase [Paenibacillus macquariensis subsp. macquariensis]SIR66144.1 Methyltransferase domain-containing protein [Paenibacillus macquariensis]